jgi:hypothetical protein
MDQLLPVKERLEQEFIPIYSNKHGQQEKIKATMTERLRQSVKYSSR